MSWEVLRLFQRAAKYFYMKYRDQGGSLDMLAQRLNITSTYLSAVINGSRVPSLELQCQIADTLHGPYDKFIAVGRQLEKGIEPDRGRKDGEETVEMLIARLTHLVMDYKKLAGKLELSEKKFMDICLTTGDMIFETDEDYAFQFVAGKVYEVTGLAEEELVGRKFSDFVDGPEWQRIRPLLQGAIDTRKIFDQVFIHQDGGYRHCIAKPIYSGNDRSFKGFRGTCRDITTRKNLEKALDKKIWLLQSSIDAIADSGVVITDMYNRILHWNAAFEEFFNLPRDIRQKTETEDLFACLEDKAGNVADFRRCIDKFAASSEESEESVDFFTLTNGKKIRRRAVPIYCDGVIAGRVFFLRDTTYIPDAQVI